jgi:hypothetical protein
MGGTQALWEQEAGKNCSGVARKGTLGLQLLGVERHLEALVVRSVRAIEAFRVLMT